MTNKKKDRIQKKNKNDINLSLRSKDERQEEIRTILEKLSELQLIRICSKNY